MNQAQYETNRANAYLVAVAEAFMAGASAASEDQAGALAVAGFDADFRADAGNAEYAFNLFCQEGPGVKAADILDGMGGYEVRDAAFWNLALSYAQAARAAWLAA